MNNIEIANLILDRIGPRPVPFESVRELSLQIYHELEGQQPDESFNDVYEILLSILPLTHRGADIDDYNVSTGTTWSSSKITSVLEDYVTNNDASVFLTANDVSNFVTNDVMNSSLQNYYTKDEIDSSLYNKADKTELENYATLDDISTFLVPNDVSIYATIEAVNKGLELKQDTLIPGNNITIQDNVISALGDVFNASNYYTKAEVDASLNLKADKTELENYATKNDVSAFITKDALDGYATEEFVNSSLGNYYTKSEVNTSLGLKQDTLIAGNNITIENNVISATGGSIDSSNYYTKAEVDASLNLKADKTELEEYAKVVELTQAEYNALATKETDTLYIITDAIPFDPSNYYTKDEVDYKLDDYATKNDINAFITQNDVSIYAIASDVDASLALKADKTELNNYATKNDISTFITSNDISTFITENDASIYLTDEDLVGYATESFVNSSLGNYYTKLDASTLFNPYNTVKPNVTNPTARFIKWNERGQIVGEAYKAYAKPLSINGVGHQTWRANLDDFPSIYAPTTAGTEGYCLVANSSGIPVWSDVLGDISTALATILGV